MFGLGMPEILMILAIALIVIGPKKLPEVAKTLGRAMGEFKRSAQDLKRSIDLESTVQDVPPPSKSIRETIKDANKDSEAPKDKGTLSSASEPAVQEAEDKPSSPDPDKDGGASV